MGVAVFAPILDAVASAFVPSFTRGNSFYFSVSNVTSLDDILSYGLQVKISRQDTNESIINSKVGYIDVKNGFSTDPNKANHFYFTIQQNQEITSWDLGESEKDDKLYKMQIRFKTSLGNETVFSEWSNVLLIKPVHGVDYTQFYLTNAKPKIDGAIRENVETSLMPLFELNTKIAKNTTEYVDKYKFELYEMDTDQLLEDSGWLQRDVSNEETVSHRFKYILDYSGKYYVNARAITQNGYQVSVKDKYHFSVVRSDYGKIENHYLSIDSTSDDAKENACIHLTLSADLGTAVTGVFVIQRTSEKTNFKFWEDIYYFSEWYVDAGKPYSKHIYTDFSIESGVAYKYCVALENQYGIRSQQLFENFELDSSPAHIIHFDYAYLYSGGVQLKLKYNNKMSNFKYTTLANKQDTLGSKYPTIMKNGQAYYAEFPITGLITLQQDNEQYFVQQKEDGYYYKKECIIPKRYLDNTGAEDRLPCSSAGGHETIGETDFSTNLSNKNFYMERAFREKVMEFLNDGEYKIYRSSQVGNKVINLMNVSFTPNEALGRMIYEFSATAYEVEDFSLERLSALGLVTIGNYSSVDLGTIDHEIKMINQIVGMFSSDPDPDSNSKFDIWYEMCKKSRVKVTSQNSTYQYRLNKLLSFRISVFPVIDLTSRIWALKDKKGKSEDDDEIKQLEEEINELENIQEYLKEAPPNPNPGLKLNLGSTTIYLQPNKVYTILDFKDVFNSFNYSSQATANPKINVVNGEVPLIIDYSYTTQMSELKEETIALERAEQYFGQLAGVFTDSVDILEDYNPRFKELNTKYNTFKMPWLYYSQTDGYQSLYIDVPYRTPFINYYATLNLLDVIKENARRDCAKAALVKASFYNEEEDPVYDFDIKIDENVRENGKGDVFEYSDTLMISIEADEGTILKITSYTTEETYVRIGPTCRYILYPSESLISEISFTKPTYAIVDYYCKIIRSEMGEREEEVVYV